MKFKFDHMHYVPVLRLKGAEKGAFRQLTAEVRNHVTPLLELVITKKNSPSKIADDVRTAWGQSPFFLDDINFPESADGNAIVSMIGAMRSHGLLAIPVTGLNREIIVGTSKARTNTIRSQRGPPTSKEEGNAEYKPPTASSANSAGQRGSESKSPWLCCIFRKTEDHFTRVCLPSMNSFSGSSPVAISNL